MAILNSLSDKITLKLGPHLVGEGPPSRRIINSVIELYQT